MTTLIMDQMSEPEAKGLWKIAHSEQATEPKWFVARVHFRSHATPGACESLHDVRTVLEFSMNGVTSEVKSFKLSLRVLARSGQFSCATWATVSSEGQVAIVPFFHADVVYQVGYVGS